jgi:1-aminocyclopropane-1-carboxylate deaminase/D-cysteine desulfhydrase-like pyridoxal-dependent ACC family enzyme
MVEPLAGYPNNLAKLKRFSEKSRGSFYVHANDKTGHDGGGEGMRKRSIVSISLLFLLLNLTCLAGCGGTTSTATNSTPTTILQSPTSTPTQSPLSVTSLVTSVSPDSFIGINCGATASFTFSTVVTVAKGTGGQIAGMWDICSSHIPGSVSFTPGETSKTVTYTLKETNIQVSTTASTIGSYSVTTNGKIISSTPAVVTDLCSQSGKIKLTSLTLTVSPASVTGITCGSIVSFVYTAAVTIAPNSNGGNVSLNWSFSNSSFTLTFATYQPGAPLTQTITYLLSGRLEHNNIFPPSGSISSTSPNALTSVPVKPYGPCIPIK